MTLVVRGPIGIFDVKAMRRVNNLPACKCPITSSGNPREKNFIMQRSTQEFHSSNSDPSPPEITRVYPPGYSPADSQPHKADEAGLETENSLLSMEGEEPISPPRATEAATTSKDPVTASDGLSAIGVEGTETKLTECSLPSVVSTDEIVRVDRDDSVSRGDAGEIIANSSEALDTESPDTLENRPLRGISAEDGSLGVVMPETIDVMSASSEFSIIFEVETTKTVAEPDELTEFEHVSDDRSAVSDSEIHEDVNDDGPQDDASEARSEAFDVDEEASKGIHEVLDGSETTQTDPDGSASVENIDFVSISNPDEASSAGVVWEAFPQFKQEDTLVERAALPHVIEPVELLDSPALSEWSSVPSCTLVTFLTCLALFLLRRKRPFEYRQCCCTKFLQQRKASKLEGAGPDSSAEESVTSTLNVARHQLGQIRNELSQMREERDLVDMELVHSSAQILKIISTPPLPDSVAYIE